MKNILNVVKILFPFILFFSLICLLTQVLERKDSYYFSGKFYKKDRNYEVLFFGSSHVQNCIDPMQLWNEFGITSYNLAYNGNTIPVSYWIMYNSITYHKPQIAVVDIYSIWPNRYYSPSSGHLHAAVDAMPLSINKYRMLNDLMDDSDWNKKNENYSEKKYEFLFKFLAYHSRWSDLNSSDFSVGYDSLGNGYSPLSNVATRTSSIEQFYNSTENDCELSIQYLYKIIDFCNENNISLILINTGFDCTGSSYAFSVRAKEISHSKEIPYLDLTDRNIINDYTDISNSGENTHLNVSGARKVTSFIGTYISDNYTIREKDTHEATIWNSDFEKYSQWMESLLKAENVSLKSYLALLANNNYSAKIQIYDTSIWSDSQYMQLLLNLGIVDTKNEPLDNYDYIDVISGGREAYIFCSGFKDNATIVDNSGPYPPQIMISVTNKGGAIDTVCFSYALDNTGNIRELPDYTFHMVSPYMPNEN